ARAAAGGSDGQAEEVRVRAPPQGRIDQRVALAFRLRPGARGLPSGNRGVLPLPREEGAAEVTATNIVAPGVSRAKQRPHRCAKRKSFFASSAAFALSPRSRSHN